MKKWLICLLLSISFSSNVSADDDEWLNASESLEVLQNGKLISSGQYKLVEGMHTSVFLIGLRAYYCEFDNKVGVLFKCKEQMLMPLINADEDFIKLWEEEYKNELSSIQSD